MKLLALITDGPGAAGGIARYNSDLMNALTQTSAISAVTALPRLGSQRLPSQKLTQLEPIAGRNAWALKGASLAARSKFDILFCGHLNAAPLAAWLARLCGARLWLQVHGIDAWTPRGRAFDKALRQASLVTAVSRYTRERLLAWSNADPARVRVLPNTIGEITGRRTPSREIAARHALEGCRVILTVGRLSSLERYKGHDRIIRAMPEIVRRCPDARYLIVGSGDDETRLRQLAAASGTGEKIIFAGAVSAGELPEYFQLADVFAMPSTGEGFGIVYLEAAAAGLPVIAANRDGSRDALADGRIGVLIDPDDTTALADAVVAGLAGHIPAGTDAVRRFEFPHFLRHVNDLVEQHF